MQKLYRSEKDKILFGVCGGFGEYFEVDPVLVRLVFILFALAGGGGVLLYLVLAFVIPKNPLGRVEVDREEKFKDFAHKAGEKIGDLAQEIGHGAKARIESIKENRRERRGSFFGIILIALGLILLVNIFMPAYWMGGRFFWPLIFILLGLYLIARRSSGGRMAEHHHHHHDHPGPYNPEQKSEDAI